MDFARLLATRDPLMLVGGQAVNLWALYYKDRTSDLVPFVSRDADVLGDRETLIELAKLAGTKPQFFPMKPPTNEVGVVVATDPAGSPMIVQVLRGVRGAMNEELREPAYTMKIGEVRVEVPGPIALLKAKIANVTSINQSGRQDGRHVHILCRIMPAYLDDLKTAAVAGRMDERKLIEFLERLLAVILPARVGRILAGLGIDRLDLFSELQSDRLPRLDAFLTKRLPQCLGSKRQ